VHLDIIKVFYSPTDAQMSCLKKTILKFTLKRLQYVLVQSHYHQERIIRAGLQARIMRSLMMVWLHQNILEPF